MVFSLRDINFERTDFLRSLQSMIPANVLKTTIYSCLFLYTLQYAGEMLQQLSLTNFWIKTIVWSSRVRKVEFSLKVVNYFGIMGRVVSNFLRFEFKLKNFRWYFFLIKILIYWDGTFYHFIKKLCLIKLLIWKELVDTCIYYTRVNGYTYFN